MDTFKFLELGIPCEPGTHRSSTYHFTVTITDADFGQLAALDRQAIVTFVKPAKVGPRTIAKIEPILEGRTP